ncbi:hypothetical protein J7T55_012022 [Diaporthe amygdali]|uniref:uncharacterized protein n=1 Tax=Phomopsis amygdali TaxID=1214568 RepID=UPI0022FF079E|nr:uncharacterized protein J7T55_012022 [Diaporthe amygdali]KAJ0123557.1 hypothetical protein J7T55_012022 [Diaporthe amygdali]
MTRKTSPACSPPDQLFSSALPVVTGIGVEVQHQRQHLHQQDQKQRHNWDNWANWALLGSDIVALHHSLFLAPKLRAPTSPLARHPGLSGDKGAATAKVTDPGQFTSYDRYERYESPDPAQQRQQRTLRRSQTPISPEHSSRSGTSTPLSHRGLRRTPRFVGTPSPPPNQPASPPRRVHLEAVSVGISPGGLFATADPKRTPDPAAKKERRHPVRQLSQDLLSDPLEEASTTLPPSFIPPRSSSSNRTHRKAAHPAVHISQHTHSAILWALEEALRQPNPFTPDLIEENASMADLRGAGGQPAVTNGFSSSTSRPTAPPAQTGSPSGIKGPRMIMRERQAREERQRAERDRLERQHAEQEAREVEEQQRRMAERRAPAAGAGPTGGMAQGGDPSASIPTQTLDPAGGTQRRQQQQPSAPHAQQPALRPHQPSQSHRQSRAAAAAQQQQQYSGVPDSGGAGGQMPSAPAAQPGDTSTATKTQPRNSFPHAFERWEALSAHWEGLTSFWIRKLQQHADEIDRDPVSAQLSRQVSDLSAAGANLFHAVVELQRLRASSERKFQRWFFETRSELERHEETKASLERALQDERHSKAAAIQEALENERANSKTQKRVNEMQKELLISKEEARRAWEELGRREQEERDRTFSLQQGLPTIVGGVQVVPMTQGVSRGPSTRDSRQAQQPDPPSQQYPQQYSQAKPPPPAAPSSGAGGGYYEQPHDIEEERPYTAEGGSEAGYSEGEYVIDAQGNFVRDSHGDKVPYRAPGTPGDDDSDSWTEEYETPSAQHGVSYPPSASQWSGTYTSGQPDYTGTGYAAPGWETMPRHHHPTRLSDVLEEDETRSRTSASQSQVSRA